MPLTPAQEAAALIPAPPLDTCVVAGPGSGKTTVLIDRYCRLVAAGTPPSRILAITFTEKATLHMRRKLAEAFHGQPAILREIEHGWVSTLHGFCLRLLREHALAAEVDPEFRLMDEAEARRTQDRAVEDSLDALFAARPAEMRELLAALGASNLAGDLREVYDAVRAAGAAVEELREQGPLPVFDGTSIQEQAARLSSLISPQWKAAQRAAAAEVLAWCADAARLERHPPGKAWFALLGRFRPNLGQLPVAAREPVRALKETIVPELTEALAAVYFAPCRMTLVRALEAFDRLYRRRKREAGVLDFADLEERALRLLREHRGIRAEVTGQFDQIVMDEFQDTNGVQAALLDLVRRPDRFYAVGDINQSIYGFRHADPAVFRAYRDQVAASGRRLCVLRENWRSRPEILTAVSCLASGLPGVEPHELVAARSWPPATEPCVEVWQTAPGEGQEPALLEARWMARRIRQLAEGGTRFGQIAVLFRTSSPMALFARALGEEGIPYVVRGGRGFYESREVADLICLLRVLANPRDEVSLAAVLRSPLCGVSDETLWRWKQEGNLAEAMFRATPATAGDREEWERLAGFRDRLRRWRALDGLESADRWLAEAMDAAGLELRMSAAQRSSVERFLTELRGLLRRHSLDAVLEDLERTREADPRDADPQSEEREDRVTLQTMHSAKGLEFPVVILPALHTGTAADTGCVEFAPGLGLGVKWRNPATSEAVRDPASRQIAERKSAQQKEEANRLLYVAMTRAEERLILSWDARAKRNPWTRALAEALDIDPKRPEESRGVRRISNGAGWCEVAMKVVTEPPEALPRLAVADEDAILPTVLRPVVSGLADSAVSVTDIVVFAQCPRRYRLTQLMPEPSAAGSGQGRSRRRSDPLDASEIGVQVHALLAGLPVDAPAAEALWLAERFHASELGRRAGTTLLAEREFDFLFAIDELVVAGQIDLWFEDRGRLVLVDYKTDDVDATQAERRARAYALQVHLYALALERYTGKPVDEAYVHFLRPDVATPVVVDQAAREGAVAAALALRDAQESARFPLNEGEACERCPWFRRVCPSRWIPEDARVERNLD
jgi:ATP-dependent exoDNAse (exonuclease V) beta subunit